MRNPALLIILGLLGLMAMIALGRGVPYGPEALLLLVIVAALYGAYRTIEWIYVKLT